MWEECQGESWAESGAKEVAEESEDSSKKEG